MLRHIIDSRGNEAKMHLQLSKLPKKTLLLPTLLMLAMLQVLVWFGFFG